MPTYELWDDQTGNVIGDAASSEEAATILRELAIAFGRDYLELVTVVRRHEVGSAEQLGSGTDLLAAVESPAFRASAD